MVQKFKEWGEDDFVQHLVKQFSPTDNVFGIGDDCAVVPSNGGPAWLVTTDTLVEGIHFLKNKISALDLGYKTVAVNVSDIAAMGGCPHYAFLAVAIPKDESSQWVHELIQGVRDACYKWNLQLLGGDTVGSKRDVFLNLTLIGSVDKDRIKYRHGARVGDIICVTGYLGDSGGGLQALQEELEPSETIRKLQEAHFRPNPDPEKGRWLAAQDSVHAMMDISDGLNCDLQRLLKCSKVGAIIEMSKIPISPTLEEACKERGWNSLKLALTGGEDYCLLLTVTSDRFGETQQLFKEKFNTPLFDVGRITEQAGIEYQRNGQTFPINYINFDHFL